LEVVERISSIDSNSSKSATARCPAGKQILGGGGGLVWNQQTQSREVVLTRMEPIHPGDGTRDSSVVTGVENSVGEPDDWYLESYAICGDPMPGYEIVGDRSITLSDRFIRTQAHCTGGRKVIGTGAKVSTNSGEVGLHVMRASMQETFSYAQANEDFDGYFDYWNVNAYAVCVDEPAGYEIVQGQSPEEDSEGTKAAFANCPAGKHVHGGSGALGFNEPGHVSLTRILINPNFGANVEAIAVENTPTTFD
jgi:ferredoxin